MTGTVCRVGLLTLAVGALSGACSAAPPDAQATQAFHWDSVPGEVGERATADSQSPELPRLYVDTRAVQPTGRRITVARGGDVQRALDDAHPGDMILLEAGAEFVGSFVLPRKQGDQWITIRSSTPDAELPPETRVRPDPSHRLATLVAPKGDAALRTEPGAHHYRIVGLEITTSPNVTRNDVLVEIGAWRTQRSRDQIPHHIIIDRSYIHGHATLSTKRCIAMNSAMTAVVDSYLADCHDPEHDSQAIVGWNGPGPFKIVNNYLEGAGENVMFGGGDPTIRGLVPSDIEIRRNHFFKPMSWKGVWRVKNVLELKNARRVLIEGNVFENNWVDGQVGFALVFKSETQEGHAPWSVTRDVTVRLNKILNSPGGVDIMGTGTNIDEPANHILIAHNVFDRIGTPELGPNGRLWQLVENPTDITFEHNTGFAPHALLVLDVLQKSAVTVRDNIVTRGEYGIMGSGQSEGKSSIAYYLPGARITHNVIVGGKAELYPAENLFPATTADVGFVDFARGNYRLTPASPYKGAATSGGDVGADMDALERATAGVAPR